MQIQIIYMNVKIIYNVHYSILNYIHNNVNSICFQLLWLTHSKIMENFWLLEKQQIS